MDLLFLVQQTHPSLTEEKLETITMFDTEWYTIAKDKLFLQYLNGEIGVADLFEQMSQFYSPDPTTRAKDITKDTVYLYIPTEWLSCEDAIKLFEKELKYTKTEEKFREDYQGYITSLAEGMTQTEAEARLNEIYSTKPVVNLLLKQLARKGNILSGDFRADVTEEMLTKNPYSRLLYSMTQTKESVKNRDYTGYEAEFDRMSEFLAHLGIALDVKSKFTDVKTLPEYGKENKNPWQILDWGVRSELPLVLMENEEYKQKVKVPLIALRCMGYDIKAKDLLTWKAKERAKWYKENGIKTQDDLKKVLEEYVGNSTTIDPRQVEAYVEESLFLKKRLGEVKGYVLMIPRKEEQSLLHLKKLTTKKEILDYMQKKFRYEKSVQIGQAKTEKFGDILIYASWNTKNRDEYFGYAVDNKYMKDYSNSASLFVDMMQELSTAQIQTAKDWQIVPVEDEYFGYAVDNKYMKDYSNSASLFVDMMQELSTAQIQTAKDWQIVPVEGFVWCVNNRDFKMEIPSGAVQGCHSGVLTGMLKQLHDMGGIYKNYLVRDLATGHTMLGDRTITHDFLRLKEIQGCYGMLKQLHDMGGIYKNYLVRDLATGHTMLGDRTITHDFLRLKEIQGCYTTGQKGMRVITAENGWELAGLTDKEYKAILTAMNLFLLSGDQVAVDGKYMNNAIGKNAWKEIKPQLVVPSKYKIALLLSNLTNEMSGDQVAVDGKYMNNAIGKNAWKEIKPQLVVPSKYKIALLLSNLTNEKASGNYFTNPQMLTKRSGIRLIAERQDNKQVLIQAGEIERNYVFLKDEEYQWIMKYMGVTDPKQIDYSILRRKVRFFYDNMEIYRVLKERAGIC